MQNQLMQTEKVADMVKAGVIVNFLVKPIKKDALSNSVLQAMEQREIARL